MSYSTNDEQIYGVVEAPIDGSYVTQFGAMTFDNQTGFAFRRIGTADLSPYQQFNAVGSFCDDQGVFLVTAFSFSASGDPQLHVLALDATSGVLAWHVDVENPFIDVVCVAPADAPPTTPTEQPTRVRTEGRGSGSTNVFASFEHSIPAGLARS